MVHALQPNDNPKQLLQILDPNMTRTMLVIYFHQCHLGVERTFVILYYPH